MATINDHGTPVISSRQWTTALSPNAAGTGWNYIVASWPGGSVPIEWVVLKDLTGTPTQEIDETLSGFYPNSNFQYTTQVRAQNGRIFFPLYRLYTAYYDPTTEEVVQIGPVVEDPPINPNASTAFYAASFDVDGLLYFATQESQNRPSCIVVTDTDTLEQTILGYVGENANAYTTYGYHIAPDTITAEKYIYVAYGQDPWQLWALNITPGPNMGVATKLYEVPATGNIAFTNISGEGWVAVIHTNVGQPDDIVTRWWCLDGAIYEYTSGEPPPAGAPATRNVTPASNPLVDNPELDTSAGVGVVGWRNGDSGPYTYVNYSVTYKTPVPIQSLVPSNDGIVGNAEQYNGWFQYYEDTDSVTWFGTQGGHVSRGPRINPDGTIYIAGYPNGVMYSYDPDADWDPDTNPLLLGYVGLNGTQYAGIKYASYMAWAGAAGAEGRVYVCGTRERNGVGSGIGYWDKATGGFAGTYAEAGMSEALPAGLCVLSSISRVVMSTELINPPGTANLYVFDYDFNLIGTLPVIPDLDNLGQIYETSTPNVITGIVQGSGNSIGLWQYNVQTETFIQYVELPIIGELGPQCQRQGGTVWIMSDDNLVRIDINALTGEVIQDLSSIAPVERMSFSSNPGVLFVAGGVSDNIEGANLYSLDFDPALAANPGVGVGAGGDAILSANGSVILVAGAGASTGLGGDVSFSQTVESGESGASTILLLNDEGSTILRAQPVYSESDGGVRLAVGDGGSSARVIGLVADTSIVAENYGRIVVAGTVVAEPDEWDAVCGTTGGLVAGTVYYLHPLIPGRLTATAPSASGQQLVPVIKAVSPTTATIHIKPPVLL